MVGKKKWGRRSSDNQPYPKTGEKCDLPTNLDVVTTRKPRLMELREIFKERKNRLRGGIWMEPSLASSVLRNKGYTDAAIDKKMEQWYRTGKIEYARGTVLAFKLVD